MDSKDQHILENIVKRCVKGDRKAQQELYETYYGKMMGVCYRYSNNAEDAKDLLQDGFVKVFSNLKKYNFKMKMTENQITILANDKITKITSFPKNLHNS